MDTVLSVSDVATRLGISARTAWRIVVSGKVKAHRIGGQWRVFEADLRAYLESCSNAHAA